MEMDFGRIITKGFDPDGNFHEIKEDIVEGIISLPISRTVEIRIKVRSIEDEVREYIKFSNEVKNNPDIIKPSFRLETSRVGKRQGHYFVVKSYTKLERSRKA